MHSNEQNARNQQPLVLPVMPIREILVLPHTVSNLFVGRKSSMALVEKANKTASRKIFLILVKDSSLNDTNFSEDKVHSVGVICQIQQVFKLPDGTLKVLVQGLERGCYRNYRVKGNTGEAEILLLAERPGNPDRMKRLEKELLEKIKSFSQNSHKLTADAFLHMNQTEGIGAVADALAGRLTIDYHMKQEILETFDTAERLRKVIQLVQGEIDLGAVDRNIREQVKKQMEKSQREYYFNEQIRAINRELGREDDPYQEIDELIAKIKAKDMPEPARERAISEIRKLKYTQMGAADYTIMRSYIDWLIDLPWNKEKPIETDIRKASAILDADHYGLEKPKERILEYLAVQKLSSGVHGPILCLVGPPGVGKTSLARSIAKATGREYLRLALGGVKDESEIRGHRRTYIGALPGKILQSLKRVSSNNPLFCLDEIDKLASDNRGDPASALLEVLDPEQNKAFMDHYLDLDYDLSHIFFITTANSLDGIPAPLLDRMEVIELNSYLETEKYHIGKNFLIPKQIRENGLKDSNLKITDNSLLSIIRNYTSEAGVRNLERQIAKICRKTAVKLLEENDLTKQYTINPQSLPKLLGAKTTRHDKREQEPAIGVATGLAWTARGGEILFVEANVMPGNGNISTTGKLGDVMQESARAAMTYVRSHSQELGLNENFYTKVDIHIHVPDGATPKDGPSAGITIATAITSALLGVPVRNDVAMTGEISLRGRVLPIGGLREKLVGAKRAGITTVIVPEDNRQDIREVPADVLKDMEIVYVMHVTDVLPLALDAPRETIFSGESTTTPQAALRALLRAPETPKAQGEAVL